MTSPVVVTLPNALLNLFPGCQKRVDVTASTVGEMIEALDTRWPGMRDRLCDSTPHLRRHINVFIDGERAGLQTALAPGARVFVIPAITGG